MHAPVDAEPKRRRVGVFGGTFDPIHYGHLAAADEVANRYCLDEVMFVPAGDPWQKSGVTSSEHRYLMTVLATTSHPRFTVSRLEIDRGGRSYTVDTLTDLRTQHPDWEIFFICGADAIAQMSSWKDAERLEDIAQLLAVSRPGHPLPLSGTSDKHLHLVEVPAMAISSTDCRDRVANGRPIWYLVPDGVVQYIAKHRLYTNGSD